MEPDTASDVTLLLRQFQAGREDAADRLFPLIYEELRGLARGYMRGTTGVSFGLNIGG